MKEKNEIIISKQSTTIEKHFENIGLETGVLMTTRHTTQR
jgi:hypothetical protein